MVRTPPPGTEVALRDRTRALIRPIRPDDKHDLQLGLKRSSPETRYRRFMGPMTRFTDAQLRYLTEVDYDDHFAWVAIALDEPGNPGMGVSRYVRDVAQPDAAEAAVAVVDAYQGKGLGTLLLEALALSALDAGIKRFVGTLLASNDAIHHLLEHLGATFGPVDHGEVAFQIELPSRIEELQATQLYRAMRAAAAEPGPLFTNPHAG